MNKMSRYQVLQEMPCRRPINRYVSASDVYEGAVPVKLESYSYEPTVESFDDGAYEPSVSRESYDYEPTVESFDKNKNGNKPNGPVVKQKRVDIKSKSKKQQLNMAQSQGCNCQCKPQYYPQYIVVREPYQDPVESDNCNCGPNHRAYRMEQCGYNQAPSWERHRAEMQPQPVRESMEPGMENSCGCVINNSPYKGECSDYNSSPTWNDQRAFRENVQNTR